MHVNEMLRSGDTQNVNLGINKLQCKPAEGA